ncbi:hypothetical protein U1Q18_009793 [Sarracenia purpurea var. burkii]
MGKLVASKYPLSSINCATTEIASFGNMLHRVKCQLTLAEEIDDGVGPGGGSEESEDAAKATNSEGEGFATSLEIRWADESGVSWSEEGKPAEKGRDGVGSSPTGYPESRENVGGSAKQGEDSAGKSPFSGTSEYVEELCLGFLYTSITSEISGLYVQDQSLNSVSEVAGVWISPVDEDDVRFTRASHTRGCLAEMKQT